MRNLSTKGSCRRRQLFLSACLIASSAWTTAQAQTPPSFVNTNDDKEWTMPAKNVASTRYSSLDQINTTNAKNLKVAFTFSLGTDKGAEGAPLKKKR